MTEQTPEALAQNHIETGFELVGLTFIARERLMRQGKLDPEVIAAANILPDPAQIPIRILKSSVA